MLRCVARLLTLAAALPAAANGSDVEEPPRLVYQLSERADAGVGDAYVPPWDEGTILYAAVDGVALRESPSGDARRLRSLPAGTKVRVIRGDAPLHRETGFVHRWVLVAIEGSPARGHVFGGFLTPLAIVADLDGDGRSEVTTAAFTPEARAVVRIASPGLPTQSVSFRVAGEGFLSHRGGTVTATLVPASEAGVALVRVFTGQEACADNRTTFVSFLANPGHAPPRPRIALEVAGLVDPPNIATAKEEFDAPSRTVKVRLTVTTEDEAGNTVEEPEKVTLYRLREGVYRRVP